MPIDQEVNKALKEMWRLDEKMSGGESLTREEKSFYNDNLDTITRYYRTNNSYWNEKKPI